MSVYAQIKTLKEKMNRGDIFTETIYNENKECFVFLGNGKSKMGRSQIFKMNKGLAIEMNNQIYQSLPLNGVFEGKLYLFLINYFLYSFFLFFIFMNFYLLFFLFFIIYLIFFFYFFYFYFYFLFFIFYF